MPSPALVLWADSTRNAFAASWQSNLDASNIILRQGDAIGIELHWVRRTTSSASIMEEVPWPVNAAITLAVGRIDAEPTSGTFRLSYGTANTTALPYNCTATAMQAALNELPSIISEGGVTVTKTSTSYRVVWNNVGTPVGPITVASNDLTPTSSIGIATARAGSLTERNLIQLHIKQAPVALCTSWVNQDAPSIAITQVHAPAYSGDFRIWRVKISPFPKGGSFRLSKTVNSVLTWSTPIDGTPSAGEIQEAIGLTTRVVGNFEYEVIQTQITGDSLVNVTSIGSDASGLIAYEAKYGVLNLNTLDLELLLAGNTTASPYLEIEVNIDGSRETLVQRTVTVVNDLIDSDSYTLTEYGDVIPADSVLRFDTSQNLTAPEKAQARTNIGALSSADLSAYDTKDTELEGRLGLLEATFTNDVKDALNGASTPSDTNPFATTDDLDSLAPAVHTHAIADVTGLTDAINGKAPISHTHTISSVSGLQDVLDNLEGGKADTNHTHAKADIGGLEDDIARIDVLEVDIDLVEAEIADIQGRMLTAQERDAIDQTPLFPASSTNPFITRQFYYQNPHNMTYYDETPPGFSGNYTTTSHPLEIGIRINGNIYYVPARLDGVDPNPPV